MLYFSFFFFFNDTATTEIYTLSLHDALPISPRARHFPRDGRAEGITRPTEWRSRRDRKSTRLNSSHSQISYAVFCLKKKKENEYLAYQTLNDTNIEVNNYSLLFRPMFIVPIIIHCLLASFFFFFNDTATTEIYTLSLHDALPIPIATDSRRGGTVSRTDRRASGAG